MNLSPMTKQTILSPFKKSTGEVYNKEIEGYRLGDSQYFAMKIAEGEWGLVHYPTGFRIGDSDSVPTRKQVVELIDKYQTIVEEAEKHMCEDQVINK